MPTKSRARSGSPTKIPATTLTTAVIALNAAVARTDREVYA